MQDIGTLGGSSSFARDINNKSQIAGDSNTRKNQATHAFLYSNNVMHDLGTLFASDSFASGINNKGQVVGYSRAVRGNSDHSFLYSNGRLRDLNSLLPANSGWELISGFDINDVGQIVGSGIVQPSGNLHAFLLTPRLLNRKLSAW